MKGNNPIQFWRAHLTDSYTTWVLFPLGTCVILDPPGDDPAGRAAAYLGEYGPVVPGTDTADFNVVPAPGGRLVTCYRPDILVFISHDDAPPEKDDLAVGLIGRLIRDEDAHAARPQHVAIARHAPPPCACLHAPGKQLARRRDLGMDSHYAEAGIWACRVCGRPWLRYFYENEAFSHSGRWYLGQIPVAVALGLTAHGAKRALESLPWYFSGGSYFDGQTGRSSGIIML